MEFLYFFISKGGKAAVAAVLFFSTPTLTMDSNNLIVKGKLNGIITEKMERILKTGTEIKIKYYVSLVAHENGEERLLSKHFIHTIKYDPLQSIYLINSAGKTATAGTLKEAERLLGDYRVMFPHGRGSRPFDFYAEATIDYLSSLDIDLAGGALWDYYIPNKKIQGLIPEGGR